MYEDQIELQPPPDTAGPTRFFDEAGLARRPTRTYGQTMRVQALQTGHARLHRHHQKAPRVGPLRRLLPLIERQWTGCHPVLFWVLEFDDGITLIDTGASRQATVPGYLLPWHPFYRRAIRFEIAAHEPDLVAQLEELGVRPPDVRRVIITHLHWDHVGGIEHFPHAEFLVSAREFRQATGPGAQLRGYMPHHWPNWFSPKLVSLDGPPLGPFSSSYAVGDDERTWLVPTPGHTKGHMSVLVREDEHHLFFAGDASYSQELMLEGAIDSIGPNARQLRDTVARIKRFTQGQPTVYLPSHDAEAIQRLDTRQTVTLATR